MITLFVVVLSSSTPTISAAPGPCAAAQRFLKRPETYDQAESALNTLRASGESDPCVKEGFDKLGAAWREAQSLYAEGKRIEKTAPPAAREKYVAALRKDPRFADAASRLALLGRIEETDPYLEARLLGQLGLTTDAVTAAKTAVKSGRQPPIDIDEIVGGGWPWTRRLRRGLERYGIPVGEFIALLCVFLYVMAMIVKYFFGEPRLDIEDLNDSSSGVKIGANIAAMIRDHLKQFSRTYQPSLGFSGGGALQAVTPVQTPFATSIPGSVSWLAAIPNFIAGLLPRRKLSATGYLHPRGRRGAGLTLLLSQRGRVLATATVWQRDFEPDWTKPADATDPDDYYQLAEPAAIWLLYTVSEELAA